MTEKVKVTQEEFDWLDYYGRDEEAIDYMMNTHSFNLRPDSPIVNWSASKLARALLTGYEVRPIFKDGDIVFDENLREVGEIGVDTAIRINENPEEYRHIRYAIRDEIAEWKEQEFWREHGREVWQLKVGDTLIRKNDIHTCDVKFVEDYGEHGTLLVNGVQDEYIESIEELKIKYEVFCFVEDRKDKRVNTDHSF